MRFACKHRLDAVEDGRGIAEVIRAASTTLLRDAESLSKFTKSQPKVQPEAQCKPDRTDSPKGAVFSDPLPGVATHEEYALSYHSHEVAKTANDVTSLLQAAQEGFGNTARPFPVLLP